jgi:hypothetical protein
MNTKTAISLLVLTSGVLFADVPANLRPPELTATDLARISNLRVVKGRLPNIEGFRIESYQLLFRDTAGKFHALSQEPIPYQYDPHKKDDIGELILALREEKGGYEITLLSQNYQGNQRTSYRLAKKGYGMIATHEFKGESGRTTDDLMNIVEIGDQDVVSFHTKEQSPEGKPAALVIRTFRKK